MLAKRVVPTMLCRGRALVKGKSFAGDRSVGHVMQAARVHAKRGVDELLVLDIAATAEGRGPDLDLVRELSTECYIPVTVGGGVRSIEHIDQLLRAGADRVAVCTFALQRPTFVSEAAAHFGSQAITAVVDVRSPGWPCSECGTSEWHLFGALVWALSLADAGAGEILLQSIDRDGTMQGYDIELIRAVSEAVDVPVIASGGCSGPEDMLAAIQAGASAVAAGALFQFSDETPRSCAQYLHEHGIPVRIP